MIANRDSSTTNVLLSAVSFLKDLHDDATQPAEARRRLRQFQSESPDFQLELVSDEEAYEQTFHYDLLVRFSEQESISLSYCHDHGIPWAMRGARRWTERDLLRVNDVVLRIDEALGCMEFDSNDSSKMQALVNMAILREALELESIPVSPDELQVAMDAFRSQRGLFRAADTHTWLRERGISHQQLEGIVVGQAMAAKFRTRVVVDDVEAYFHEHHGEFDTAAVALISYREEEAARKDFDRIAQGEIGFYTAAEQHVLCAAEQGLAGTMSIARIRRSSLPAELATKVFSAADEVVGPIRFAGDWTVAKILAIAPATLDDSTRQIIEGVLFERWLNQQRASARIEWYWGNVQQTGSVC
jgi:putative peptide maturation system protein